MRATIRPDEVLDTFPPRVRTYRRPALMVDVIATLRRQQPLRMRRIRKDMAWLVKQARRHGVDATGEIPSWLR